MKKWVSIIVASVFVLVAGITTFFLIPKEKDNTVLSFEISSINLKENEKKLVEYTATVDVPVEIIIADKSIADTVAESNGVYIIGLKAGMTTLTLKSTYKNEVVTKDVGVFVEKSEIPSKPENPDDNNSQEHDDSGKDDENKNENSGKDENTGKDQNPETGNNDSDNKGDSGDNNNSDDNDKNSDNTDDQTEDPNNPPSSLVEISFLNSNFEAVDYINKTITIKSGKRYMFTVSVEQTDFNITSCECIASSNLTCEGITDVPGNNFTLKTDAFGEFTLIITINNSINFVFTVIVE